MTPPPASRAPPRAYAQGGGPRSGKTLGPDDHRLEVERLGRTLEAPGRDVSQAALGGGGYDQLQLAIGAPELDLRQQAGRTAREVVGEPEGGAEATREAASPAIGQPERGIEHRRLWVALVAIGERHRQDRALAMA